MLLDCNLCLDLSADRIFQIGKIASSCASSHPQTQISPQLFGFLALSRCPSLQHMLHQLQFAHSHKLPVPGFSSCSRAHLLISVTLSKQHHVRSPRLREIVPGLSEPGRVPESDSLSESDHPHSSATELSIFELSSSFWIQLIPGQLSAATRSSLSSCGDSLSAS